MDTKSIQEPFRIDRHEGTDQGQKRLAWIMAQDLNRCKRDGYVIDGHVMMDTKSIDTKTPACICKGKLGLIISQNLCIGIS